MSEDTNDIQEFLKGIAETHQLDQLYQALGVQAGMLWHFYTRLTAQGFTDEQAMTFARDMFRTHLEQSFRRGS